MKEFYQELEEAYEKIRKYRFVEPNTETIEKLKDLKTMAGEMGMFDGKLIIENVITVLELFWGGKKQEDSVRIRIAVYELYKEKVGKQIGFQNGIPESGEA
jgi:hypothetical protein